MVKVPIPKGAKLFADQCPKTQEGVEYMSSVPYANAISSLMYAMVYTRPNIVHKSGFLSRYMSKPGTKHWTVVKRVFRYLHGTVDYAIYYQGRPGLNIVIDLQVFLDVEWDGDLNHRRSTSDYGLTYLEEQLVG